MRIKITTGADPLGLCLYIVDAHKQQPEQPAQFNTNLFGRTPEEWAEEFRFSHLLNRTDVKVTMVHLSFSLTPGERVDPDLRLVITLRVLDLMGYGDCMWIEGEHFDQQHKQGVQHWHCGVSTVDLDGKHVSDKKNYERLRAVEQQIEEEFDLVRVPIRAERDRHNLPTGEYRMKQRLGIETATERLWQQLQQATADQPSLAVMTARLKAAEIEVHFREENGEPMGISFAIDGQRRAGGDLGPQYTFGGLQRNELVQPYDSSQAEELRQMQQRTAQQSQEWLQQWQAQVQREHEQQARRQYYRDRYRHYASSANLSPEQHDLEVARRALSDRQGIEETHCIVTSGDRAQILLRQQGTEAAQQYVVATTQQAKTQLAQEQAKSQKQIEL